MKDGFKKDANEAGLTVAVAQMPIQFGEKEKNLTKTAELAQKAAQQGAELVIFPELCNTGYGFNSRREAAGLAEQAADGQSILFWSRLAAEQNIYLVAGLLEKADCDLYNTAVLVGPQGVVGKYRKLHLFHRERLFFEPGNLGLPVFNLPFGRVGILLCYDLRFFEAGRILMLQGADIICVPTNWLVLFDRQGFDAKGFAMQNYAAMVMANTNNIFIACANRIGQERGINFFGKSMIVGPSGWLLAGLASDDCEEILTVRVNLMDARKGKTKSEYNNIILDRRKDIYDEMLGYAGLCFPH